MSRDSNGNFTNVAGIPVVSGTTISSTVFNNFAADVAIALTESLSREGDGGMNTAFKNASGAVGAPGITWTSEDNSGFYRISSGVFGYSVLGTKVFEINADGLDLGANDLDTTGNISCGVISVTSGNDSDDWDTAFSWGDHAAAGYEPADATILKDADIGVTVQAYDGTILNAADIGVSVQAYDADILVAGDIGTSVQAYSSVLANTTASYTNALNSKLSGIATGADVTGSNNAASATYASAVTCADESTDTTCFVAFVTAASGNMPIKTGSNLTFNSATGVVTSTDYTVTSDLRMKKNIETIDDVWPTLLPLIPITHEWKDDREGRFDALIAQDVQKIMPWLVEVVGEDLLTVNYSKLTVRLLKAIQDLYWRVLKLEGV